MVVCKMWCCGAVECAMERNDLCEEDGYWKVSVKGLVRMNGERVVKDFQDFTLLWLELSWTSSRNKSYAMNYFNGEMKCSWIIERAWLAWIIVLSARIDTVRPMWYKPALIYCRVQSLTRSFISKCKARYYGFIILQQAPEVYLIPRR